MELISRLANGGQGGPVLVGNWWTKGVKTYPKLQNHQYLYLRKNTRFSDEYVFDKVDLTRDRI